MIGNTIKLQNLCRYFKECYQEDNKSAVIDNIFEDKLEEKFFFNEEQLLEGRKLVITSKQLADLKGKAYLYRKEKELLYGSTIITGKIKGTENNKDIKLCAPLLFFPLTIEETTSAETIELALNLQEAKVNFGLLSLLYPEITAIEKNDLLEGLLAKKNYCFDRQLLFNLVLSLETEDTSFDRDLLTLYPLLLGENSIKNEFSLAGKKSHTAQDALRVLNAGFITLVKKSKGTRGIIEEMEQLSRCESFSRPLTALFSPHGAGDESRARRALSPGFNKKSRNFHPLLSESQAGILESSGSNPVTLVIGPPGTGKSYTIASIALEHLFKGESVLIASRMDQAVDVIAKKIREQIGTDRMLVRGGDGERLRELKKHLENMLILLFSSSEINQLHQRIETLTQSILTENAYIEQSHEEYLKAVKQELKRGTFLTGKSLPGYRQLKTYLIKKSLIKESDLFELTDFLERRIKKKCEWTAKLAELMHSLEHIKSLEDRRYLVLKKFLDAIKARTDGKQEAIFNILDFSRLFKIFPIWLVTSPAVYNVLPLEKELFDVVIIDEATQCDITSCLPLLQRAKRAVIVGDPHQLQHVSFVSRQKQYFVGKKYNLTDEELERFNYREKSILHGVMETLPPGDNSFFLDEHFRSLPQIIAFSNQYIYNNSLKIMTENPQSSAKNVIEIIRCDVRRSPQGFNEQEAAEVLGALGKIIEEDSLLDKENCRSVGILSPFRKQVDYIHGLLVQSFPLTTLEKHDLLAGTAHTFQGEERDIMLLSLAIDKDTHKNSAYFISKDDVLNVSITRARAMQKIFISLDPEDISAKLLLRRYLEFVRIFSAEEKKRAARQDNTEIIRDAFLQAVLEGLRPYPNLTTYPAYSIAGMTIDLVVDYNGKAFGIDLIGFPGEFVESFSLERYKMYYRAGFKIIPLSYSRWFFNREKCIKDILKQMDYINFNEITE